MSLYSTIFLSFALGLIAILISQKLWKGSKNWQNGLLALAGVVMIGVILWYLLQILIGLPSVTQTVDLPAISLGLLCAYGFQNAAHVLRERAKNKFK